MLESSHKPQTKIPKSVHRIAYAYHSELLEQVAHAQREHKQHQENHVGSEREQRVVCDQRLQHALQNAKHPTTELYSKARLQVHEHNWR